MIEIEVRRVEKVAVKWLKVEAGVRYWEDGKVNGVEDTDGNLIPLRDGDCWCPLIDLEAGHIALWPEGTTASIHYKVCDNGRYWLLDADRKVIRSLDGYVPEMLDPTCNGYGDYIILNIDGSGKIDGWRVDLKEFMDSDAG